MDRPQAPSKGQPHSVLHSLLVWHAPPLPSGPLRLPLPSSGGHVFHENGCYGGAPSDLMHPRSWCVPAIVAGARHYRSNTPFLRKYIIPSPRVKKCAKINKLPHLLLPSSITLQLQLGVFALQLGQPALPTPKVDDTPFCHRVTHGSQKHPKNENGGAWGLAPKQHHPLDGARAALEPF